MGKRGQSAYVCVRVCVWNALQDGKDPTGVRTFAIVKLHPPDHFSEKLWDSSS